MNDTTNEPPETDDEIEQRYLQSLQDAEEKRNERKIQRTAKALEYQKSHPEKTRRYSRNYYRRNRLKLREYRQRNIGNRAEYLRDYQQKHPHIYRINKQRRRARKRALPDTWTQQDWFVCLEYWKYCCAVCGYPLKDVFGNAPHADHWHPLNQPGCPGTIPNNMICLCDRCNRSKHDDLPDDWLMKKFGKKKAAAILKRINAYFDWVKAES